MASVHRICPACGKDTPLEARHCPRCGHDTLSGLPAKSDRALPAMVGKAALPVLATAGTLVARVMWRLLRDRFAAIANPPTAPAAPPATQTQTPATREPQPLAPRRGRSIRIRTSWAVGDANGMYRQGYTDQKIDFDE